MSSSCYGSFDPIHGDAFEESTHQALRVVDLPWRSRPLKRAKYVSALGVMCMSVNIVYVIYLCAYI